MKDPYAAGCAHKMWHLRNKFPSCFWAAPEEFFTDGALVNRGTDFGLMPSAFEPGGIVQHEFFVGATPVIAFKTGGLKDSVIEFDWNTETGSGFTFEQHAAGDFIWAMKRAMNVFGNKQKYNRLREGAFKATMAGETVCKAWLAEFFRLRNKVFVDESMIKTVEESFKPWSTTDFTPISIIQEIFGQEKKKQIFQDYNLGAEDDTPSPMPQANGGDNPYFREIDMIISAYDQAAMQAQPQ